MGIYGIKLKHNNFHINKYNNATLMIILIKNGKFQIHKENYYLKI
jgi:hypothetical protein